MSLNHANFNGAKYVTFSAGGIQATDFNGVESTSLKLEHAWWFYTNEPLDLSNSDFSKSHNLDIYAEANETIVSNATFNESTSLRVELFYNIVAAGTTMEFATIDYLRLSNGEISDFSLYDSSFTGSVYFQSASISDDATR